MLAARATPARTFVILILIPPGVYVCLGCTTRRGCNRFANLLPPAAHMRHDHRPADARFLLQPRGAVTLRIRRRLDRPMARINDDARRTVAFSPVLSRSCRAGGERRDRRGS